MGTTLLAFVVPLLATSALLLLSVATPAKAALIQASSEFTELRSCDGQPCLISLLRQKRQDPPADPPADIPPAEVPVPDSPPAETTTAASPPEGAQNDPVPVPASPGSSGEGPPGANLGEIPLPPVMQQMPNLPPNFPYPDVKVVQEVPIPTKPRKKLILGGGANPYPFPPIGPPMDPVPPPMEVPTDPMEPVNPVDPEPKPAVVPIEPIAPIEPTGPVEKEPYPTPIKPDCKPGGGYGPPQDWRFPKARGHKKCPPSAQTNYAAGQGANYAAGQGANYADGQGANYADGQGANYAAGQGANYADGQGANYADGQGANYAAGQGANYAAGQGANYAAGNENYATANEAAPEDVSVHMRTAQRDDEGDHPTTVHPHGTGSATSVVCSMGTVLFAMVAYFLNVAI